MRSRGGIRHEEAVVRSFFHIEPLLTEYSHHNDVAFSRDGQTFAVVSDSDVVTIFRTDGCVRGATIPNKKYRCSKCLFHREKMSLYLNSKSVTKLPKDHAARGLDISEQKFTRYYIGHTSQITSMAVTSNGLITSALDRTIRFWDDSVEDAVDKLDIDACSNIALHPNGNCLIAASESRVSLYDVRNLKAGAFLTTHIRASGAVQPYFGMQGKSVMIVGRDYARRYDLAELRGSDDVCFDDVQTESLPGCAYTPDEKFVMVPTRSNSIIVSDAETGDQVTVLVCPKGTVDSIEFSSAYHSFVTTGTNCLFWTVNMETYHSLISYL